MALRLRVVSEHSTRLGPHATKVFGVHGGTIGRSSDNEWILPDPERYLSGKHARVDFRGGNYVLVDTSSNGTYVNGAQVPLGKYHDYQLQDGDYIRLGEYEFLVSIDESNDFPPDESAIVAYDGRSPSSAAKKSTANDLGADLDLSALLETTDQPLPDPVVRPGVVTPGVATPGVITRGIPKPRIASPGTATSGVETPGVVAPGVVTPHDAYGQSLSPQAPADEDSTPWHMLTRPLKVEALGGAGSGAASRVETAKATDFGAAGQGAAGQGAAGSGPPSMGPASLSNSVPPSIFGRSFNGTLFDGDVDAGLSAFCRGAGIDLRSISSDARSTALQLAGQLLRESILGLMDLNHGSHEFRNRFRISAPPVDAPESPLNFSKGIDEALVRLLNNLSTRAGSVEAIRSNFRELKAQHTATMTAMHAAFEEFLQRVDPKELEERFERAGKKRGVFGTPNKSKYWELYAEMYAGVAQRPDAGFPHLYTETFAKAFEAKLRTLVPPRRSGIGSDRDDDAEPGDQAVGDL
jgi:type VI secretion system protein